METDSPIKTPSSPVKAGGSSPTKILSPLKGEAGDSVKDASSPVKPKSTIISPKDLSKTPPLEDLVTRFLSLQFGEERIINLSPMTEIDNDSDSVRKLMWSVKIDKDDATVVIDSDGKTWVICSYCRMLSVNRRI
jgi:hypothetical protein